MFSGSACWNAFLLKGLKYAYNKKMFVHSTCNQELFHQQFWYLCDLNWFLLSKQTAQNKQQKLWSNGFQKMKFNSKVSVVALTFQKRILLISSRATNQGIRDGSSPCLLATIAPTKKWKQMLEKRCSILGKHAKIGLAKILFWNATKNSCSKKF